MEPVVKLGENLNISFQEYSDTGIRIGIWASSGRGKTNAIGVIVEELLDAGLPAIIIDPEGEFWTLKEMYRTLVVGGPHGDLPVVHSRQVITEILETAFTEGLACVFDLSEEATNAGQQRLALPVMEELFRLATRKRQPVALVIEEIQVFAPQSSHSHTGEIMNRLAKQGRKRGIVLVAASQRTQAVSKEFMSQLNFPVIGGFEERLDYEAIKHHAGGKSFEELKSLPVGHFWFPRLGRVGQVRRRKVTHAGSTPAFGGPVVLSGTVTDGNLNAAVARISALMETLKQQEEAEKSEIALLRQRIGEMEEQLRARDREIQELKIALRIAAARVDAPGNPQEGECIRDSSSDNSADGAEQNGATGKATLKRVPRFEAAVIENLVKKVRRAVTRKLGGFGDYCDLAVRALLEFGVVTPPELCLARGLSSKQSEYRMRVVCRQLAAAGLARQEGDRFVLAVNNLDAASKLSQMLKNDPRGSVCSR